MHLEATTQNNSPLFTATADTVCINQFGALLRTWNVTDNHGHDFKAICVSSRRHNAWLVENTADGIVIGKTNRVRDLVIEACEATEPAPLSA